MDDEVQRATPEDYQHAINPDGSPVDFLRVRAAYAFRLPYEKVTRKHMDVVLKQNLPFGFHFS